MISHSAITAAFMLTTAWLIGPIAAAAFITGIWFSREQYWEELKFRAEGRGSLRDVLLTIPMVFRPMRRNMDFFAPVAVAWVIAAAFVYA